MANPLAVAGQLAERYHRWVVRAFFGLLLLAGWQLAPDYGSFIDEELARDSGQVSLTYLYECVPAAWLPARAAARLAQLPARAQLANYADNDHGVAFELPLALLEKASNCANMHDVLVLRHRAVFVVCWVGCLAFYWLAAQRLDSWRVGLLGVALLLLSPRVSADFFYNSKDAVFLACCLVATATAVAFLRQPRWQTAGWHALACAVALDVRIMGVLVPVITGAMLGLRAWYGDYAGRRVGRAGLVYLGALPLLTVAGWPYLWAAPLARFGEVLRSTSHYRWTGPILYQGHLLPAGAPLPWSYVPVWVSITTPVLYLGGLLLSLALLAQQLARRGRQLYAADEWQDLLFWALGLGPVVAVLVLHAVLFDGWRHLYFAYPPLLLLALRGLVTAWRWQLGRVAVRLGWKVAVGMAVVSSLAFTGRQMVQLHPLECLYFNGLAGSHPELRYEYDYWGLSLRQGMAWILAHDSRPLIRVQTNDPTTGLMDRYLLPLAGQGRLQLARAPLPADYLITTYRFHPQPYPLGLPVYSLRVEPEGRRVHDIFRLTPP